MEKQTIVDENDNVIGTKVRSKIMQSDIYRVSCLWLRNSKGEVLLAQRAFNKKNDPGKWGPAVAGTVSENETYEENIQKEILEELGIDDINLAAGPKKFFNGEHRFFYQVYFGVTDKDESEFKIQKEEVEGVKWFNEQKFLKEVKEKPDKYISSVEMMIEAIYKID